MRTVALALLVSSVFAAIACSDKKGLYQGCTSSDECGITNEGFPLDCFSPTDGGATVCTMTCVFAPTGTEDCAENSACDSGCCLKSAGAPSGSGQGVCVPR